MSAAAGGHLPVDALLDWWLHDDASPESAEAVEAHLLQCDACGEALDELVALGDGVRAAIRAGAVSAVATGAFVDRLVGQGLKVRQYRLPAGSRIECSVAPDDDLLVSRLEAPLAGVARLDAVVESSLAPGVEHRLEDVPFDAKTGEVLWLPRIAQVKTLPAHTLNVTLLAVAPGGARELGRYAFHHRPWAG